MKRKTIFTALVLAGASLLATSSSATDGYFQHGYGLVAKGMGGASTATTVDTFGGATNPAKMVFVGDRVDFGLDLFSPRRSASRSGSLAGIDASADSNSTLFEVPEFGYNRLIDPRLAFGVSVYGNGGMNTNYPGGQIAPGSACAAPAFGGNPGPHNLLCGTGRLGVDLIQLVIAPTASYKVSENQAIGIAPLLAFQRFRITGLQAFAGFSTSPNELTNRGYDTAQGVGARIGWLGKMTDSLSLGAAYSTKISMTKFEQYKGLFAEEGGFDMPENYNAGMALKILPNLSIALDYQRINYSQVKSVGNPSSNLLNCAGGDTTYCLGGSNGAGFGWHDVNVWKLGVEYGYSDRLALRGGFNHTNNPIRSDDVTINILAPGVIENHLTLGLTYLTRSKGELTLAYMHAFRNSVSGPSFFNKFGVPAGDEKIEMYQDAIGIAYGWKL
jgi:long-chain fatty acid transport protein